jgi:hypothetical protein
VHQDRAVVGDREQRFPRALARVADHGDDRGIEGNAPAAR